MVSYAEIATIPDILTRVIPGKGGFPNNSRLPILIYQQSLRLPEVKAPETIEQLLRANHWTGCWRNGIYTYHHYHSTAHEVLAVYRGSATVQLGGETGYVHKLQVGDVLVLPAGVAHKNMGATKDFAVVGAYPEGQDWDMCYGAPDERPRTDENIARVAMPKADPLYGFPGPLLETWHAVE